MSIISEGLEKHPCFNNDSHHKYGRIHLPVAKRCNISCNYCNRNYHCVNQSRPGVTRRIMTPAEAIEYLKENDTPSNNLTVVGIAGPGEPLDNDETFQTLKLVKDQFPDLIRCVSTNGLLLSERIPDLVEMQVSSVTLTLNTLRVDTAIKIYAHTGRSDKSLSHGEWAELFLNKQRQGLIDAVKAGLTIKLNTVFIPGINDDEIEEIALFGKEQGADIMNVMALIPQGRFKDIKEPSGLEITAAKITAEKYMHQLNNCGRCRADTVGIIDCPRKVSSK